MGHGNQEARNALCQQPRPRLPFTVGVRPNPPLPTETLTRHLLCPCHFCHPLLQTWAVLYGVMGYASYLVGKTAGWGSRPMVLYGAQLALNLAWQPLFFLAKKPGVAQIDNAGASITALSLNVLGGIEQSLVGSADKVRKMCRGLCCASMTAEPAAH